MDITMEFSDILCAVFSANGMERMLTPDTAEKFTLLAGLLTETNLRYNLTAVTDPVGIAAKHFADSVALARFIPQGSKIIDVGCGAGFPSLPLAVIRPDLRITSLDSTAKKLDFITQAAKELVLDNISVLNSRAEEAGASAKYRELFDVSVSRAVARLNILCELCLPFIRAGGCMIAAKGISAQAEIDEARQAITVCGGEMAENAPSPVIIPPLEGNAGETLSHNLIIIQKKSPTPIIYPRNFARINKKPL